jgi:hypothetical protein
VVQLLGADQLLKSDIDLLAESNAVKLILYGFMVALTDTVRRWIFHLGPGILDIIQGQEKFLVMNIWLTAEFYTSIRPYSHLEFFKSSIIFSQK